MRPYQRCSPTITLRCLPSEVVFEPGDDPIQAKCVVNLDSVESVSVGLLVQRTGKLRGDREQNDLFLRQ